MTRMSAPVAALTSVTVLLPPLATQRSPPAAAIAPGSANYTAAVRHPQERAGGGAELGQPAAVPVGDPEAAGVDREGLRVGEPVTGPAMTRIRAPLAALNSEIQPRPPSL